MARTKHLKSPISLSRKSSSQEIDACVGRRIRARRLELEMSQEQLATLLGITFQQVQKYEKGINRVSASRLWDISRTMGVPVSYFFELIPPELSSIAPGTRLPSGNDPMERPETVELIRAYYQIANRHQAQIVKEILIAMSQSSSGEE